MGAESEKDFNSQLELLGQLPSAEGRERAVRAVFAAIKSLLDAAQAAGVAASLPSWLQSIWNSDSASLDAEGVRDPVDLVQRLANYTYRGAADRVLRAVLGSLVEALSPTSKDSIARCLPESLRAYWAQANRCSLGENMGEFL
jgi:uncharacterized protein (DUF2267 family)